MNGYVFLNIEDFCVAWETYCGRLISVEESMSQGIIPMSSWMASLIKRNDVNWLHNEIIMENIRQLHFSSEISRLQGMYFFEDESTAIRASEEWHDGRFNLNNLVEVEFSPDSTITKVDHNWIYDNMRNTIDSANESNTEWIHKYWRGETTGRSPLWELLVKGKAKVLGTELRSRAYETIRNRQPRTLGLLEISRVGWELGSHYGHIVAWLVENPSESYFEIQYAYDERDKDNEDFIKKLQQYEGPRNTMDFNANTEFVSPDLRSEFFKFDVFDEAMFSV